MTTTTSRAPRWLTSLTVAAASLGGAVVTLAFALSFTVLSDLAQQAGIPGQMTWAWPVVVDVTIVVAMLAIVARRGVTGMTSRWPWTVFAVFTVVSVCGNAIHALIDADAGVEWAWLRIAVGAVPPVALLCSVELVVGLLPALRAMTVSEAVEAVAEPQEAAEAPVIEIVGDASPVTTDAVTDVRDQRDLVTAGHVTTADSMAVITGGHVTTEEYFDVTTGDEADAGLTDADSADSVGDQPAPIMTVPAEPTAQVAWIAERLDEGRNFTKAELSEVFAEAGLPASPSTVQRRLREARALVTA